MAGQVVEDDNVAFAQCRHQLGFSVECERLGAPVSEGRVIDKTLTAGCPPARLAMLVLTEVSSIKASRCRWLAINGWRFTIQICR